MSSGDRGEWPNLRDLSAVRNTRGKMDTFLNIHMHENSPLCLHLGHYPYIPDKVCYSVLHGFSTPLIFVFILLYQLNNVIIFVGVIYLFIPIFYLQVVN